MPILHYNISSETRILDIEDFTRHTLTWRGNGCAALETHQRLGLARAARIDDFRAHSPPPLRRWRVEIPLSCNPAISASE